MTQHTPPPAQIRCPICLRVSKRLLSSGTPVDFGALALVHDMRHEGPLCGEDET